LKNKNRIDAFKLLVRQNRCIEALEMVGLDVPNKEMREQIGSSFGQLKDEAALAIEIASLLHRLGETKPAGLLFDLLVMESASHSEKRLYDVCAAEYRVGRVDEAFAHIEPITLGSAGGVLRQLFSKRLDVATVWWSYFSQAHPNEPRRQTLKRVHSILSPKSGMSIADVKQLAARAADFSKGLDLRAHWLEKISETIALHGDAKLAHTYLQDSANLQPTSARLMKLGDSQARLTQWKKAAETYGKVWEMDQSEPLALYLQGWATTQSGEEARGDGLKQRAKLLPLGNTHHRFVLAEGLQKRGLRQAADRQFEMVTRLGSGNDRFMLNAAKILGNSIYPTNRFQAAEYWQQLLLSCLRTTTRFGEIEGYLQLPHIINKAQARGFLEQGKTELAAAAASRSHAIIPGETRLAIDLVPEFDKAQSGKFADELFAKIYAVNIAICERFPNSASHHNNLAWMAAKCHRRIDDALKLSQRATTLQPENSGYLDTLAELHFLAGDRDKAIELAQRCLKFDAKNVHYQEQLERFRKAPK
jgi:tetratricopeptide (TPR) repeat protein